MIRPGVSQVFLTEAEWIALNPVVPARVTAISTDTGTTKIGDGTTTWSNLVPQSGQYIGRKRVQSNRDPTDNEGLNFCAAEDKWVFRLIGCHLTQTECTGMALTVYPNFVMIIEIDDATLIGTGRMKIGNGTTQFVNLPWIGAPPQEYIEHLSNFSNPHATTKAQVGLGNVTNDAQLKRAADDFLEFGAKTSLHANDVILIEDSEAAGQKKYITVGQIQEMIISYVIALGG